MSASVPAQDVGTPGRLITPPPPFKLIFFEVFWPRMGLAKIFVGVYPYFWRNFFVHIKPEFAGSTFHIIQVTS